MVRKCDRFREGRERERERDTITREQNHYYEIPYMY